MKSEKIISVNPSKNYEIIAETSVSTTAHIDEKVAQAHKVQQYWALLDLTKRIEILEEIYNEFVKRKDEIGRLTTLEMGMPASVRNDIDIDAGLHYMRGYLDFAQDWLNPEIVFEDQNEIHYLFFQPRGVMAVSSPWNYPFCNFIWGVIPNLVVGNTVVFKHSENCPLTAKLLEDIMLSQNLPIGVFNEIYGDGIIGDYLMNSAIDGIHFTGSTQVGKHLYQVAANKFIPATLELGGSAPGIVFDDADIPNAIASIYWNRFVNSGQTCDGLKRLIVHQSCFDSVVSQLQRLVATKKLGDPQDLSVDIGPLAAKKHCDLIEQQVADALDKGAKIICGAKRPQDLLGAYFQPTILTNITTDMRVWKEETFGPVLPVVSFDSEQQAIALANDTIYGLGGYIYTNDKNRALHISKQIQAGNISVNGTNYNRPQDPFGGYKYSGIGREHGKQGLRELCNSKVIALKK